MKRNACQKCAFAVHDDNPHCGLRGFRTSFNVERCSAENDTVPNGYELQEDGYFSWVEKEMEYPKTYKECCYVLGFENTELVFENDYRDINPPKEQWKRLGLINQFNKLLICRDAYWKIAGEEMGLGKPWKPDYITRYSFRDEYYSIYYNGLSIIKCNSFESHTFIFPTEEMRDAFKENFDKDLEFCKELL